jgi:hypothetical protein
MAPQDEDEDLKPNQTQVTVNNVLTEHCQTQNNQIKDLEDKLKANELMRRKYEDQVLHLSQENKTIQSQFINTEILLQAQKAELLSKNEDI